MFFPANSEFILDFPHYLRKNESNKAEKFTKKINSFDEYHLLQMNLDYRYVFIRRSEFQNEYF
jgi:hypothetical protein